MVVLAFVINVCVEKFKMRSMCFSFASVLKCASCAWDTETFLRECLRLCVHLLLRALKLFLPWLVITVSLILRSMHSWIKTHTDSSSLCQIQFQFSTLVDFVSPANCHQPESRAVGHPCNPLGIRLTLERGTRTRRPIFFLYWKATGLITIGLLCRVLELGMSGLVAY